MRRRIDFTPPGHAPTNKRALSSRSQASFWSTCKKGSAHARWNRWSSAAQPGRMHHERVPGGQLKERCPCDALHPAAYGAVRAAEEGAMAALAQFKGHDDSRTTEKQYARFSPDYLARAPIPSACGYEVRAKAPLSPTGLSPKGLKCLI
jgi:hypothetical protein